MLKRFIYLSAISTLVFATSYAETENEDLPVQVEQKFACDKCRKSKDKKNLFTVNFDSEEELPVLALAADSSSDSDSEDENSFSFTNDNESEEGKGLMLTVTEEDEEDSEEEKALLA
jgi:hypothetical protein